MQFVEVKSRKGELPQLSGLKESLSYTFSPVPEDTRITKIWINVNDLSGNEELHELNSFEPGHIVLGNQINTEISMMIRKHIKGLDWLRKLFTWPDSEYMKFCLKIAIPQDSVYLHGLK
jgi:hypothetical protein